MRRLLLLLIILTMPFSAGCFKDKGGGVGGSMLNLTPQQKLHAVIQVLNEQNILTDESELRKQVDLLERAMKESSGETKYRMIYYLTFLRIYSLELLAHKSSPDRRKALDMVRVGQKDVDHFRKARFMPDEHKFLTGLMQSVRLEFETNRERRREAFESARLNFLFLLREKQDFETLFRSGNVALELPDVLLSLARLYRRWNDPYRAWETMDQLEKKYPQYAMTPIGRVERGYLQVLTGDLDGALETLSVFRGRNLARELFYEEGLWMLEGVCGMLAKENSKFAMEQKTFKSMLKEVGGYFSKGAGKLEKYVGIREPAFMEYGRALRLHMAGRSAEAEEILYDLLDDPLARRNKFHALDSSRDTVRLTHFLLARCLEETRSADGSEVERHLEAAEWLNDTTEVDFSKIIAQTDEVRIQLADLLPKSKTGTREAQLRQPPRPPVPPRPAGAPGTL